MIETFIYYYTKLNVVTLALAIIRYLLLTGVTRASAECGTLNFAIALRNGATAVPFSKRHRFVIVIERARARARTSAPLRSRGR